MKNGFLAGLNPIMHWRAHREFDDTLDNLLVVRLFSPNRFPNVFREEDGMSHRGHQPNPRQLLLAACQWGGSSSELRSLLTRFTYSIEDLEAAVEELSGSASSGSEVIEVDRNIRWLQRQIEGRRLRERISKKKR